MNALTDIKSEFGIASVAINHTIVIPCYNEAKRLIPSTFIEYLIYHPLTKFVFVNDASTDNTIDILRDLQCSMPDRIDVLDCPVNGGKAEAVRLGMRHAIESEAEYVGFWDADLATPLNAIEDFMRVAARLPELEIIYGARKAMLGHKIDRKLSRRIVSRICANMARIAVKLPITDTQAGAKIFKVTDSLKRSLHKQFTAGWLFDVELFSRLASHMDETKGRFYEFPLVEWTEVPGSKVNATAIIKSGIIMVRLIGETRFGLRIAPHPLTI